MGCAASGGAKIDGPASNGCQLEAGGAPVLGGISVQAPGLPPSRGTSCVDLPQMQVGKKWLRCCFGYAHRPALRKRTSFLNYGGPLIYTQKLKNSKRC
jgi:hypothetical protein